MEGSTSVNLSCGGCWGFSFQAIKHGETPRFEKLIKVVICKTANQHSDTSVIWWCCSVFVRLLNRPIKQPRLLLSPRWRSVQSYYRGGPNCGCFFTVHHSSFFPFSHSVSLFGARVRSREVKGLLDRVVVFQCLEGHGDSSLLRVRPVWSNPTSFRQERGMRAVERSQWRGGVGGEGGH